MNRVPHLAASQTDQRRGLILLAVGGIGASAVMTQLALMRELLGAFSGNELVFGISLGSWLLLTAAGAGLGRWLAGAAGDRGIAAPARLFIAGLVALAVIPLLQVVAVRVLRDVVFVRGGTVGLPGTALATLVLLLPFCTVSGALFTLGCALLGRPAGEPRGAGGVGRAYVADTLGSVAGGACFSFALVPWFDHFALLCFPAAANLLIAAVLARCLRHPLLLAAAVIVAAGLAVHVALVDADAVTTAVQHWGTPTVFHANSPYGRLVVTDDSGQLTFYENGVPVISTGNIAPLEETVHYAMAQRPDARRVLLIGGGVAGTAREILRYGVEAVTSVEVDPLIIAAGRRFLPDNLADPRIRTVATDGRRFVRQTGGRFDVIIVDLPDPTTLLLNRFLTAEFFAEARRTLQPGGVLAFGLGRYENFVSPELARLLSSARRTLGREFAHVRLIPGGRVYFLASDGALTLDIAARLEQRGLATRFVNRHTLDATLAADRLADLDRAVAQPAALNTDFSPTLVTYFQRHWLSQFASPFGAGAGRALGIGLLALAVVGIFRMRAGPRVIFASGFAASALEVVLLLGFQVLYGSLYRQVGLVVTVFMAGLAAGAWAANRRLAGGAVPGPGALALLAGAIAALAAGLPLLLGRLEGLDAAVGGAWAGPAVILLLGGGLAGLVGHQFPLAAAADPGAPAAAAARLYGADLAGAALGALLVSAWLVPAFGVTTVCLLTAGLNAAAGALAWRRMFAE